MLSSLECERNIQNGRKGKTNSFSFSSFFTYLNIFQVEPVERKSRTRNRHEARGKTVLDVRKGAVAMGSVLSAREGEEI
jgi:hypothetical protein